MVFNEIHKRDGYLLDTESDVKGMAALYHQVEAEVLLLQLSLRLLVLQEYLALLQLKCESILGQTALLLGREAHPTLVDYERHCVFDKGAFESTYFFVREHIHGFVVLVCRILRNAPREQVGEQALILFRTLLGGCRGGTLFEFLLQHHADPVLQIFNVAGFDNVAVQKTVFFISQPGEAYLTGGSGKRSAEEADHEALVTVVLEATDIELIPGTHLRLDVLDYASNRITPPVPCVAVLKGLNRWVYWLVLSDFLHRLVESIEELVV